MTSGKFVIALVYLAAIAIAVYAAIYFKLTPADLMQWSLAVFLLALQIGFILLVWLGTKPRLAGQTGPFGINLERLISEHDGSASFSRFQFLIFTFVVASGYVVQVFTALANKASELPSIPGGVLALIGISGGSYLMSKGIEKSGGASGSSGAPGTPTSLPSEMPR